jgi:hypothetical protein
MVITRMMTRILRRSELKVNSALAITPAFKHKTTYKSERGEER